VGVTDAREVYAFYTQVIVHRNVTKLPHPLALRPFLPELDAFARHNHFNIFHPILRSAVASPL
jgi:hypothetical protein